MGRVKGRQAGDRTKRSRRADSRRVLLLGGTRALPIMSGLLSYAFGRLFLRYVDSVVRDGKHLVVLVNALGPDCPCNVCTGNPDAPEAYTAGTLLGRAVDIAGAPVPSPAPEDG